MSAEKYPKLYVSKVLEVTHEQGLIVEVTKGKNNPIVSIWQMYRDEDGEWRHTGTSNGARNIRIPMNKFTVEFLLDELAKVKVLNDKLEKAAESKKKEEKPKIEIKAGELPDLDNPELIAAFANFLALKAKKETAETKTSKRSKKKE